MIISLDPRTFLISTSLTMAIFAVVLLSMRRSMAQTVHGLETFALANLFGTAASLLLGFRGSIPFFLSFWVGNYLLLMGGFSISSPCAALTTNPSLAI